VTFPNNLIDLILICIQIELNLNLPFNNGCKLID
jgi:hypothetical protein